jgi:hypothetical protein
VGAGALYLATLLPGIFWLDSGELVAAAHTLGVPHPPGEPVWLVLAKAASLVPLGGVATRVNALSLVLGVAALVALYGLTLRALRGADRSRDAWLAPSAALGALAFAASPALWFQSIRAEVYTLNLLVVLGAAWLLAGLGDSERGEAASGPESRESGRADLWSAAPAAADRRSALPGLRAGGPRSDAGPPLPRPPAGGHPAAVPLAAFVVGLGLGNHHFLVALALPGLLWLVAAHPAGRRWLRPGRLALLLAVGLVALLPYAVLPLRARLDPAVNWGDAATLGGFLDVVTARVFQASVDPAARAGVSVAANLVTAFALFLDQLTPPVALAGLFGLGVVTWRRPRLGVALWLLLAGSVLSKALMFLDPENPDDHGYFQTALAMLALGAAALVGALVERARRLPARPARVAAAAALAALVIGVPAWQILRHRAAVDRAPFRAPGVVLQATLEAVPPRALLQPYYYGLQFALWYGQYVEERRPDVAVVNQTFQLNLADGAPLRRWLRRAHPAWGDLAAANEAAGGAFPTDYVIERSASYPIYVEPFDDLVVPPEHLEPRGLLARVRPRPVPLAPPRDAERRRWHVAYWDALVARAGGDAAGDDHTRRLLLWYLVHEALLHLRRGDTLSAEQAVERGLTLSPHARELHELRARIAALEEKPQ